MGNATDMADGVGMGAMSGWLTSLVTDSITTPLSGTHAVNKLKVQVLQLQRLIVLSDIQKGKRSVTVRQQELCSPYFIY